MDPLFIGLTRPAMIFGVSISYAMLNIILMSMYFINTSSFSVIPAALLIHAIGYIACFNDAKFIEIYIMKFSKCNQCPNKMYHGSNSYAV
jgi:type IV secretion system protein VirB3